MDELILMNIISYSGSARSLCHEALMDFQSGKKEQGGKKYQEAKEALVLAQKAHGELLQKFALSETIESNLLLIHAEDHLSSTGVIFELVNHFNYLYQRVEELGNEKNYVGL